MFLSIFSYSQVKKPTLMILPSDNWCVQRFFITEFDNQGTKIKVPNYKQAFQEDAETIKIIIVSRRRIFLIFIILAIRFILIIFINL